MAKTLELKIPPLLLVLIWALLMWAAQALWPALSFTFDSQWLLALFLALLGSAVALAGVLGFRRASTTVNPTHPDQTSAMVTSGIYGLSRNPMYLGFLLWLLAWAVMLGNLVAGALVPAFVLYLNRFQIVPEERWLHQKFGQDFADYRARVRRWL